MPHTAGAVIGPHQEAAHLLQKRRTISAETTDPCSPADATRDKPCSIRKTPTATRSNKAPFTHHCLFATMAAISSPEQTDSEEWGSSEYLMMRLFGFYCVFVHEDRDFTLVQPVWKSERRGMQHPQVALQPFPSWACDSGAARFHRAVASVTPRRNSPAPGAAAL